MGILLFGVILMLVFAITIGLALYFFGVSSLLALVTQSALCWLFAGIFLIVLILIVRTVFGRHELVRGRLYEDD